ncbi:hydantoinase B/oxoprolinase family protein, partial [Comamonadaceae bacterium G21597-S1]|nr:hydantoinase B/oxoprolinase family protein [Comamonadaceae bacterium G21597-S1]
MVKHDGKVSLDATRSDDQASGPINYVTNPNDLRMMLSTQFAGDDLAFVMNEGMVRAIDGTISLRPGSILAPRYPAALGMRAFTSRKVLAATQGIVNQISPGTARASSATFVTYLIRGIDPVTHRFVLVYEGLGVGFGARSFAD